MGWTLDPAGREDGNPCDEFAKACGEANLFSVLKDVRDMKTQFQASPFQDNNVPPSRNELSVDQQPPSPNPHRRSSELRRGRFVDKNKEKPHTKIAARGQQPSLKRNDSLTKREKQDANHIIQRNDSNLLPTATDRAAAAKQMKTLANQGLHSVLL